MTGLTRRTFVTGAAVLPLAAGSYSPLFASTGSAGQVLIYNPDLAAGVRFARRARALGGQPVALEGDRIRFVRAVLSARPEAIYGVSRHSDQLLAEDVAREAGYRPIAVIQHSGAGVVTPRCQASAASIGTIARLAGNHWPETFAELAAGGMERCSTQTGLGIAEPAISWVLVREP